MFGKIKKKNFSEKLEFYKAEHCFCLLFMECFVESVFLLINLIYKERFISFFLDKSFF